MKLIVKEAYYYCRGKQGLQRENQPLVTVCVMEEDGGSTARGFSICSPSDNVAKVEGRKQARSRSIKGLINCRNDEVIRRVEADSTLRDVGLSPQAVGFKVQYGVVLNEFEQKILDKKKPVVVTNDEIMDVITKAPVMELGLYPDSCPDVCKDVCDDNTI